MAISERIQLEDGVSGPAKAAASAVGALKKQFAGLDGSAGGGLTSQLNAASGGAKQVAAAVSKVGAAQQAVNAAVADQARLESKAAAAAKDAAKAKSKAAGVKPPKAPKPPPKPKEQEAGGAKDLGFNLTAANVAGKAIEKGAEAALAIVKFAVEAAAAGAKALVSAQALKQDSAAAFKTYLKTEALAQSAVDKGIALSREIGGDPAEIMSALKAELAKGLPVDKAIDQLRKLNAEGKLGPAQRGITGAIERLKNLPTNILAGLDVSTGMKSLESFFTRLGKAFDPSTAGGKKLSETLERIGNKALSVFEGIDPNKVVELVNALAEFGEGLGEGLGPFVDGVKEVFSLFGDGDAASGAKALGQAIGTLGTILGGVLAVAAVGAALIFAPLLLIGYGVKLIIDGFVWLGGVASSAWDSVSGGAKGVLSALSGLVSGVWEAVTEFFSAAAGIGKGIIDGIINGILGGAAGVVSSLVGVATSAISAVKGVLQQHSPSKVFADIGANTVEGFVQGVVANDNSAAKASSAMASGAVAAAQGGFAAVPGTGGAVGGAGAVAPPGGGAAKSFQVAISVKVDAAGGVSAQEAESIGNTVGKAAGESFWQVVRSMGEAA